MPASDASPPDILTNPQMRGRAGTSFAGSIGFENVSLVAGATTILDGINLTFEAGTISCLLGPSGCGKTSLLRLAAGVARPSAGRIVMDDREVAGPQRFVVPEQRNVGLMFQDYALFPHLTVLENVAFGLTALSREDARNVARNALARVGLSNREDASPNQLSGGEQQRVALARAIAPRPQVILMDEPFSGLDLRLRDQVREETLAVVRETRATAVLVTHDPMEALEFGDRIFLLRQGRVVQQGTPAELYGQPVDAAAAQFFAAHNVFSGLVRGGHVDTPVGRLAAPGLPEGSLAEVLVRPEGIALADAGEGVEAYVADARFLGETLRLSLKYQGYEQPVLAQLMRRSGVTAGQVARFVIDARSYHVFKKP
jgi:iron(III) transport system ATP-binding protein